MRRRSQLAFAVALLAVALIGARVAAPSVVERYVNRQLAHMGDYRGSVTEVTCSSGAAAMRCATCKS